jgi:hypothetical protein
VKSFNLIQQCYHSVWNAVKVAFQNPVLLDTVPYNLNLEQSKAVQLRTNQVQMEGTRVPPPILDNGARRG